MAFFVIGFRFRVRVPLYKGYQELKRTSGPYNKDPTI